MDSKYARTVIDDYVGLLRPVERSLRQAAFDFLTTGSRESAERQEKVTLAIRELHRDRERFQKLSACYEQRSQFKDASLGREVELVYLAHLGNQVAPEKLKRLTTLETKLAQGFTSYRPEVGGKKLAPDEVKKILEESQNSQELETVWKARARGGAPLEETYREAVILRNEIARDLGFPDAVSLSAATFEFDLTSLRRFYKEMKEVTEAPFQRLKEKYIDPRLAVRHHIPSSSLKPWHYQQPNFGIAPPATLPPPLLEKVLPPHTAETMMTYAKNYFLSMGIDVSPILSRSSLFPSDGKYPHACAYALDRESAASSYIVMNFPKPPKCARFEDLWTLIHELTHAIHFSETYKDESLPYVMREISHVLTESYAILFQHQPRAFSSLTMLGVKSDEARRVSKNARLANWMDEIVFMRWASVIFEFENRFYADPSQNISDLWWECKEKHQCLSCPAGWTNPDPLAQVHIVKYGPLDYSLYFLAKLANVHFQRRFTEHVGQDPLEADYAGHSQFGPWLCKNFFSAGEKLRWDHFVEDRTGAPLSVEAWAKFYLENGIERELLAT